MRMKRVLKSIFVKNDFIMNDNNFGSVLLGVLVSIYVIVSQIYAVIFFIDYCRVDSIIEIILIDDWLAELKGLLWPFFM